MAAKRLTLKQKTIEHFLKSLYLAMKQVSLDDNQTIGSRDMMIFVLFFLFYATKLSNFQDGGQTVNFRAKDYKNIFEEPTFSYATSQSE